MQMGNAVLNTPDLYAIVQQALEVIKSGGDLKGEKKPEEEGVPA
jgi:hypothetical protein